jgi:RNA polymerase sigma-70 factor (ECF subfamily)
VPEENGSDAADLNGLNTPGRYSDLHDALKSLSPPQAEVLELVFYHGLSLEDTARVLQAPPGTVKSRLTRARSRLREWMDAEI